MRIEKNFSLPGDLTDVGEGIRAYYLGEGYEEVVFEPNRLVARREGTWKGVLGYKIEDLTVEVEFNFVQREHVAGSPIVRINASYEVKTRFRLVSRLDSLYFDLELEELERYFDTGIRQSVARRLDEVRTPVAMTAMSNTLLTALLVASAGLLVDMDTLTLILVALGISLINFVSIVGFADIVVDGMERLLSFRAQGD